MKRPRIPPPGEVRFDQVVYLVRHCDVENPSNLVYGRLSGFGLSELGRKQAERVADFLETRSIGVIYTSPQLRAQQTARAIRRRHPGIPIRISNRLSEVRTGYQGRLAKDIASTVNMFDNPVDASDESIVDVERRIRSFLTAIERRSVVGSETVAVSHAAPIAILRTSLDDLPLTVSSLRSRDPQKGSITTLDFANDGWSTRSYQDVGAFGLPAPVAPAVV